MKNKKVKISFLALIAGLGFLAYAADHIEAPAVSGTSADITDYYTFESTANTDNFVFVANTQGLIAPTATGAASFDENVLVEINIDNDGDYIEDLVIQCRVRNGKLIVFGPVAPSSTGINSVLERSAIQVTTNVTAYQEAPIIGTSAGISAFAGSRDDPFFMDFSQFGEILAGNATGFNDPGADTFAGTNVMSMVVEVPKSMLGGNTLNTWVEAKTKSN